MLRFPFPACGGLLSAVADGQEGAQPRKGQASSSGFRRCIDGLHLLSQAARPAPLNRREVPLSGQLCCLRCVLPARPPQALGAHPLPACPAHHSRSSVARPLPHFLTS